MLTMGCAPIPSTVAPPATATHPAPSAMLTPTRSATPAPTNTTPPAFTPTPSSEPPYQGVLSIEQREKLDSEAQKYLSLTPAEALTTAIELNYIGRNANPATMCGPLSIAILRDAGLVDSTVRPFDFWYLNPRPAHDEKLLESVFPPERFEKLVQELPINEVDFNTAPLYPGDFLYLFAGESGSFEHVIVVSRVDDTGRAYAVTNLNTPEGVIITEVMLYDPTRAGVGQFYKWTDRENRMIGRTGYGGYWLWRPLAAPP